MKKIIVLTMLVMFLLFSFTAVAETEYTQAGFSNADFVSGFGAFNLQIDPDDSVVTTIVLDDPKKIPLVADLDNDGEKEIIVLDGREIIIFHEKTLQVNSSITLEAQTNERFSNMITFDIDDDGFKEIILVGERWGIVHILNYTDAVYLQNSMNMTGDFGLSHSSSAPSHTNQYAGLVTIGCEAPERCLISYTSSQKSGVVGNPFTNYVYASYMSSTFLGHQKLLDTDGTFSFFCPPIIRTMAISDYDEDGDTEFIFSMTSPDLSGGDGSDDANIYFVNIEDNNSVTEDMAEIVITTSEILDFSSTATPVTCDNFNGNSRWKYGGGVGEALAQKLLTAPLVYNANPTTSGKEILIGYMVNSGEFLIKMFESDGTLIRSFPSNSFPFYQKSEGRILSNLFRAEVFDDSSSEQDFCVVAQVFDTDQLSITCGSLQDTNGVGAFNTQSIEFRKRDAGLYNVSDSHDDWQIITHSGDYDESNSNSEVITTWGVWELDFDNFLCTFGVDAVDCGLNLLYRIPRNDGAVIPVDYDGVNLDDFLILRENNLHYVDDGFSNQPAYISSYCIDPCIESVWKLNTSVQITEFTATDPEGDLISLKAVFYEGDSNEDAGAWSSYISSGQEVPFTFTANKTIGGGTIGLYGRDIENNETIDYIAKAFSVSSSGVEFGDCHSCFDVEPPVEEDDTIGEECDESNECGSASSCIASVCVADTETLSGRAKEEAEEVFSLPIATLFIMAMLGLAIGIWFAPVSKNMDFFDTAPARLGAIIISEALMLILGTMMGWLPVAILISLIILGVIGIIIFVSKKVGGP